MDGVRGTQAVSGEGPKNCPSPTTQVIDCSLCYSTASVTDVPRLEPTATWPICIDPFCTNSYDWSHKLLLMLPSHFIPTYMYTFTSYPCLSTQYWYPGYHYSYLFRYYFSLHCWEGPIRKHFTVVYEQCDEYNVIWQMLRGWECSMLRIREQGGGG